MKKTLFVVFASLALCGMAFANAQKDGAAAPAAGSGAPVELYMFISQPEYQTAINALLAEYKKVAPNVTINYETVQDTYPAMLKTKLNSGEVPDIFASTAGKEIDLYTEYSRDLSDQPIAKA
ncbi:MAG: extracellular solute-binding protein, partial [Spirochaetaceae bacterium]|nr:extracellular solute-binding protein [Spirochaetaceae bacterium]